MCLWLTLLPVGIGFAAMPRQKETEKKLNMECLIFSWVSGQIILWALFLAVCVPITLARKSFSDVYSLYLLVSFGAFLVLAVVRVCLIALKKDTVKNSGDKKKFTGSLIALWCLALALFALQIICAFVLAYEEGDDAFYVAITTMSREADRLYTKIPYTGYFTDLQGRYALAPFPVWVAVLSQISGLSGAVTSHSVMPVFVITMSYGIFYLIGKKLLTAEEIKNPWVMPAYMCLMELLVIFGGYSTYTRENFLLVRAAQGKAVLANVIILFLFYLMMQLVERIHQGEITHIHTWFTIFVTMAAGCLCSTLGSFLLCILLGLGVLCMAVAYRKWKMIFCVFPCVLVPALIILLYLKL